MLDIRLIREQPEAVTQRLANRGGSAAEQVEAVLRCDVPRRSLDGDRQRPRAK